MYDQQYLLELISDKTEEHLKLDYKAAGALQRVDAKRKEISKDVSAFANSAGGTIIYGMKEDRINKHLASEIDPVDRNDISKEWLEQTINSLIQPRVHNVVITPIEIDDSNTKVVYVVEIPQSKTVHQAVDQRYYRRFNFESVPMYDHEIRDVFNRTKHPIIELAFKVHNYIKNNRSSTSSLLIVSANNKGPVLANYISCFIEIPRRCLSLGVRYDRATKSFDCDNTVIDILDTHSTTIGGDVINRYGSPRYVPILPGLSLQLRFDDILLHEYYRDDDPSIEWIVYADNAEPISGTSNLGNIQSETFFID